MAYFHIPAHLCALALLAGLCPSPHISLHPTPDILGRHRPSCRPHTDTADAMQAVKYRLAQGYSVKGSVDAGRCVTNKESRGRRYMNRS